jgi:hypothetical protein
MNQGESSRVKAETQYNLTMPFSFTEGVFTTSSKVEFDKPWQTYLSRVFLCLEKVNNGRGQGDAH